MLNQPTTTLNPVLSADRISALDITRGIALFGILLMNITGFGLGPAAYWNPAVAGGDTGWNLRVFEITSIYFEGTMRGLFSMLFGVGMVLLTDRLLRKEAGIRVADIYFSRTMWLIVFGIIHAYLLLWWGEILYAYGVMGLLIFALRNVKPAYLIIAAVLLLSVDSFRGYLDYQEMLENRAKYEEFQALSEEQQEAADEDLVKAKEEWEGVLKAPKKSAENLENYTKDTQKGYFGMVAAFAPMNNYIQMHLYDWGIYDILSMMIIGIALYRLKIITAEKSYVFYGIMMLIGYPIGIFINYFEFNTAVEGSFMPLAMSKAQITYPVGRLFILAGHVGLIMIFCKSHILSFLQKGLAAVGRMALTNYVMHSVICMFLFYSFGFGLFGKLQRYELYYVVAAIWAFQLVASPLWLNYFRFGPLEWLWRSLTYRKLQPMRKQKLIQQPVTVPEV
ncbi:DUF418 domain-containing protein [Fulvivirga sedimenti]|jgi:uncharacterized protein|uniref:DUF418 domain-containing protein n=1 Tax=Fulvivirga sedimenti TaxID=2879465 RepID=A0A9X1HQ92_9BACT|nr:DUF418 domain-containing protein [Fulvivirga sedimenti]MCA6074339.1 DUF418 domain-containing protein [Fulvivirga sedimenti]